MGEKPAGQVNQPPPPPPLAQGLDLPLLFYSLRQILSNQVLFAVLAIF